MHTLTHTGTHIVKFDINMHNILIYQVIFIITEHIAVSIQSHIILLNT